ncbi:MAG: ABC transporter permease [Deltaproteobacteria bacterium]|nr:ABC transporter permease [Deltaproteobacteria bacterium]
MNPVNVKAIARKEFYHVLRDFRSLYMAFLMPVLLILMFGYALSLDVDNVSIVVVDHDKTPLSRDFLTRMNASRYFNITAYPETSSKAYEYLDEGTATLAIIIPPGWTDKVKSDTDAPVQMILDGADPNYATLSKGYIESFVEKYNSTLLKEYLNRSGMEDISMPVNGRVRIWFNEELESSNFIVPGIIAIIIMIVGVILTSLVIAREYENGTMETIKSLPIKAEEFFLGKAIPYYFISFIDVMVAVLMGQILFGVVIKGSFLLMIIASTIYLMIALSMGLFISVAVRSQLVANQIAILTSYLPALMLSDFVFPVENMPAALQKISYIVPAKYFIDILNGLYLRHVGISYLWHDFIILFLMFIAFFVLTFKMLKREGL